MIYASLAESESVSDIGIEVHIRESVLIRHLCPAIGYQYIVENISQWGNYVPKSIYFFYVKLIQIQ